MTRLYDGIARAVKATRETVDGLRALSDYANVVSVYIEFKNAYLKELREVTNERDKLRADYESTGCIGREMDRLQTQVKCLVRENEDLKAKLEWLSRWRKQSETPCPFNDDVFVEYKVGDYLGVCSVEEVEPYDSWRPIIDSLNLYDKYKDV